MTRRLFLQSGLALGLGLGLGGCSWGPTALRVNVLNGSVPLQLIGQFKRSLNSAAKTQVSLDGQLAGNFKQLQQWQPSQPSATRSMGLFPWQEEPVADLVTLGDAWLEAAIRQNLIRPLNPEAWPQWSALPSNWQSLVQRNQQGQLDAEGQIWGAPYRWGTTVIAYRQKAFENLGWEPTDWSDLWRPELARRIALLDQPREVIGLTLKSLGESYNTPNPQAIAGLQAQLRSLQNQVKLYSSDYYLQPLVLNDVWLVVGWSTDVLPLLASDATIKVVVPQSGTALWADVWVQPQASSGQADLINQWINFYWQPEVALQFPRLGDANSPININNAREPDPQAITAPIAHQHILYPAPEILANSEFLEPLSQDSLQEYQTLWEQMRLQTL
jgi:putative spermidine/putrescine transport system substrate-binding protein